MTNETSSLPVATPESGRKLAEILGRRQPGVFFKVAVERRFGIEPAIIGDGHEGVLVAKGLGHPLDKLLDPALIDQVIEGFVFLRIDDLRKHIGMNGQQAGEIREGQVRIREGFLGVE